MASLQYLPKTIKHKFDTKIPSSHKDIFPTLYNLTLSDTEYIAMGHNLANKSLWHCGFNDAGIIMSIDGGFDIKNPKTKAQKECVKLYKATLAVEGYLLNKEKHKR